MVSRQDFEADYANVMGTGFREGKLIVFVTKKKPEMELDDDDILPDQVVIDGTRYDVDVEPCGIPHNELVNRDHHRPVPGGVSMGNENIGAGTWGSCELEHDGDSVIVTNSHVAAGAEQQFQPAAMDGDAEQIGTLREESPLEEGSDLKTDSALIDVDSDDVSDSILGLGEVLSYGELEPVFGETHFKSGRTTGVTEGELRARDVRLKVAYGPKTLQFVGVDVFTDMSKPGDSGSHIGIKESDEGIHLTNLSYAGSDQATIAIPLVHVQEYHGELSIPGDDSGNSDGGDEFGDGLNGGFEWGPYTHPAKLRNIVDGDTQDFAVYLGLDTRKGKERIRLLEIDTAEIRTSDPEEKELGYEQLAFVTEWFQKGYEEYEGEYPFALATYQDEYDSFGRLLTYIYRRSDEQSLTDALIAEYGEDVRYELEEQLRRLLQ